MVNRLVSSSRFEEWKGTRGGGDTVNYLSTAQISLHVWLAVERKSMPRNRTLVPIYTSLHYAFDSMSGLFLRFLVPGG